jgi:hypothetical protein
VAIQTSDQNGVSHTNLCNSVFYVQKMAKSTANSGQSDTIFLYIKLVAICVRLAAIVSTSAVIWIFKKKLKILSLKCSVVYIIGLQCILVAKLFKPPLCLLRLLASYTVDRIHLWYVPFSHISLTPLPQS